MLTFITLHVIRGFMLRPKLNPDTSKRGYVPIPLKWIRSLPKRIELATPITGLAPLIVSKGQEDSSRYSGRIK